MKTNVCPVEMFVITNVFGDGDKHRQLQSSSYNPVSVINASRITCGAVLQTYFLLSQEGIGFSKSDVAGVRMGARSYTGLQDVFIETILVPDFPFLFGLVALHFV